MSSLRRSHHAVAPVVCNTGVGLACKVVVCAAGIAGKENADRSGRVSPKDCAAMSSISPGPDQGTSEPDQTTHPAVEVVNDQDSACRAAGRSQDGFLVGWRLLTQVDADVRLRQLEGKHLTGREHQ